MESCVKYDGLTGIRFFSLLLPITDDVVKSDEQKQPMHFILLIITYKTCLVKLSILLALCPKKLVQLLLSAIATQQLALDTPVIV